MQTFLPYSDFDKSARCLDNKRLGKQRVECLQIYRALTNSGYGWQNHPAVRMWKGHVGSLLDYMDAIIAEWIRRGYRNSISVEALADEVRGLDVIVRESLKPRWLGNRKFHASHRSNLLRKDPKWYGQFGWKEPNNLPYVWPV